MIGPASQGLWRLGDFRTLMVGETISELGNTLGSFALPLAVLIATGSAFNAGVVTAAAITGSIVCSMVAGTWTDSRSRRQMMLWTLSVRILTWTSMGVCLLTVGVVLCVFVPLAFVGGVASALFGSAQAGALKVVVPSPAYPRAVATIDGRNAAADLLGAPLGGLLIAIGTYVPVLVNAGSFVASWLAITAVRADLGKPSQPDAGTFLNRVREGYRYAWGRVPYRMLILQATLANFAHNAFMFALILILQRGHHSTWMIGLIQTSTAASALLGAFLAGPIVDRCKVSTTIISADALRLTALAGITLWHDQIFICIVFITVGFILNPAPNAAEQSYIAVTTPDRLQGRVASFEQFVGSSLIPFAPLTAGLLVARVHPTTALATLTALIGTALLGLITSRATRSLPHTSKLVEEL